MLFNFVNFPSFLLPVPYDADELSRLTTAASAALYANFGSRFLHYSYYDFIPNEPRRSKRWSTTTFKERELVVH